MTAEQLIALLKKCNPTFQVCLLCNEMTEYVEFVELQNQTHSVLLLPEKPNWQEAEEADDIEIEVIHEEDGFASIAWIDV